MRIVKLLNVEMNVLVRLEAVPNPLIKSDKKINNSYGKKVFY